MMARKFFQILKNRMLTTKQHHAALIMARLGSQRESPGALCRFSTESWIAVSSARLRYHWATHGDEEANFRVRIEEDHFSGGRPTSRPIVLGGINCHLIDINDKASNIFKLVVRRIVKEKINSL
jgi:hypothetical protein